MFSGEYEIFLIREALNKSAAADSGSFVPTFRFENLEIHKVFLRFSNLNSEQNLSLTALADLFRASLDCHVAALLAMTRRGLFQHAEIYRNVPSMPLRGAPRRGCAAVRDEGALRMRHTPCGCNFVQELSNTHRHICLYRSSCSRALNSAVSKKSASVISKPSQIILIVISFGFSLFP